MKCSWLWIGLLAMMTSCRAQEIVVDATGRGQFKTIQEAIDQLPATASATRVIHIRNGIYHEKLFVEKGNIKLVGESRDSTIITAAIARDEWRCAHPDDWGVATFNVRANDISLENLTVINSFGFEHTAPVTIQCSTDSTTKMLQVRRDGHQMALRTQYCTRLKAVNCRFSAWGGDTVSPWETNDGMWYFKDCVMEGGVDFYCPRGWAWAENCDFIANTGPAAIWHDGSQHEDSKTVLVNCRFSGYDGFLLGRYHRDAQFFLVNCQFAANMRDSAIYRVPTENVIKWGQRIYYYNCHRDGGNDFSWYANHLPAGIQANDITTKWVFGSRWEPEKE